MQLRAPWETVKSGSCIPTDFSSQDLRVTICFEIQAVEMRNIPQPLEHAYETLYFGFLVAILFIKTPNSLASLCFPYFAFQLCFHIKYRNTCFLSILLPHDNHNTVTLSNVCFFIFFDLPYFKKLSTYHLSLLRLKSSQIFYLHMIFRNVFKSISYGDLLLITKKFWNQVLVFPLIMYHLGFMCKFLLLLSQSCTIFTD